QLVVEAPTAAWADFAAGFEVFRVNTGFLDITGVGGDEGLGLRTAACQVDVACPVAAPFGSPISSVGRITVAGVSVCGGVLLNNTRGDQTPYFLTAYHCDAWTNPAATVVYWNYENTTCRTPGSAGGNGDGPLTQSTSGAVLRANAPQGDATLLELASAPDAEWGVDFAGWDATGDANDPVSYAVHHPNGKEKRIALEYDFLSKTTISLIGQSGIRTWRTQFEEGGIELGSSGGALFSRAGRVIGVTTGVDTLTACYPQRAYFGRVDHAWDVGSSASGRLRDWLDPDNTGARTLDPLLGGGTAPGDFALMTPFNGDQAVALNGTFTWTPAEEAAAYRIEIDDDGDFSAGLVIKADVSEAYWQTPSGLLSEDTAYWWRVTALNSYDETPAIATYSFTTMRDCNGNLTHDPYEIAQGYATDCDENGRPDECDLATESVFYASQTLGPVGGNGPQLVDGMVDARTAASDVTIRFVTRADISTSSETIEVFVNGVNAGVLYAFTTSDCAAGGTVDTIVLEADDWNAMVEAGDGSAILSMEPSSYVNAGSCGGDSTLAFTIDYTAQPTLTDADGDGLPDGCSIACSAADVTTESSTNGRPDGRITLDDFAYFISQWASDDPAVDLTVATDCQPGTGGDGVTLSDFTCFLAIWSEGCGDPREDGHSGGIADDVVIGATLPAN
ncbi:MAG: GC-type dockerin domain-anchored protein, partial [Planctomycetota bacterium]